MNKQFNYKGFTLIEVLLTMTLFVIFIGAIISLFFTTDISVMAKENHDKALQYAAEAIEITESIKSDNYLNLVDGNYALSQTNNEYALILAGTETLEETFSREINISPVYRNDAGQIDNNGENLDNQTKKITVTVTWTGTSLANNSIVLQKYISDWSGITWTLTTFTQFNAGTNSNTEVLISDPEIPDNGKVEAIETVAALEYFGSANVGEHANDVYYQNGILLTAVDKTNEGMCAIDVSDPNNITVLDCVDVGGKGLSITANGNYAYIGVSNSSKGLAIVNISNPSNLSKIKDLNIGGTGNDIDILGNHLFIAVNKTNGLVAVNISNPNSPFTASTTNTGETGRGIHIAGNYAYFSGSNSKLKIYNISNPNSLSLQSTFNLSDNPYGGAYKNSYLYLPLEEDDHGLQVINVSNPTAPFSVGTYDVDEGSRGVAIFDNLLYVAVNSENNGAKIYNISDPLNLNLLSSLDINGKGLGTFATDGYAYMAVDTGNQGVAIISTGTLTYELQCDYISQIHDSGSENIDYKYINWLSSNPPGTNLTFQIRTADSIENINTATFVGPDGTTGSYYTVSPSIISLDPIATGKRYLQWKAYFTTDGNATPSLEEVTIKYE